MTRPLADVHRVLHLRKTQGLGARRIGRITGIPVKTVQGWLTEPALALARPVQSGNECHGSCESWRQLDPSNYAYLLGMYLGDGYIVRTRNVYRLSIFCDPKYQRIIGEVCRSLSALLQRRTAQRRHAGCIAVNAYSSHWPCLFPQHGAGMKHQRPIKLEPWQREIVARYPRRFIRGLIHSDGCRAMNVAIKHTELAIEYRTYTRYQFSNRSDDIRGLFCWALDLIGVHWTQSNKWTISVSRRKDVHYLDSFVGPKR